jgi:hypothetical protein
MSSIVKTVLLASDVTCRISSSAVMISDNWHKRSGDMSFFDVGNSRLSWISPTPHTSIRAEPGCVQCGSRLEPVEFGKFNFSGKCFNCSAWIPEDDEAFEDLED